MTRRERLLEKIRETGQDPKRSLGQNFLISDNVIDRILSFATGEKPSAMVEIGPGLGALTEGLVEYTKANKIPFEVIELDRAFAENWRASGLKVTEHDALQIDWLGLGLPAGSRLVSNLPYQISSSLVVDRSIEPAGLTSMVLMFQKEVARRIAARPGSEDYGLLTVIAQNGWTIDTVCDASGQDFFPPPRVTSRVLRFRRRPDAPAPDEFKDFLKFAKQAYAHRRKLMASNLSGLNWSKPKAASEGKQGNAPLERARLEAEIEGMGFTKTARAEEFTAEQLLELSRRLR
ncbi:16S rRNA (adenine(1518)-N(6)/adenine(1519)-N(6))-dimethyltransferaseRsmA [soil metagenome]